MPAMNKDYLYPFSAALLLLGAAAFAQVTPAAPDTAAVSASQATQPRLAGLRGLDYLFPLGWSFVRLECRRWNDAVAVSRRW